MIKYIYKNFVNPFLKIFGGLFFEKKYLRGKYFDSNYQGWKWVFRSIITQKILGNNRHVKWPVSNGIAIDNPNGIYFDPDDLNNFQHFGCYYSNTNGGIITIGKGTWIAPNVGIVTTNHKIGNLSSHEPPDNVTIGLDCWIGMNAVILPGVVLGNKTIVGAGSVVTKSFPDGNCVIVGNPAKLVKKLTEC
ncbi:MAG: DapH/DapD/GlmU-related protein [Bacteroidota bacterium]